MECDKCGLIWSLISPNVRFLSLEGHTERHNMMIFLLQDTLRNVPVGFDKTRKNIFDPAEDDGPLHDVETSSSTDCFSAMYAAATKSTDEQRQEEGEDSGGADGEKNELQTICARKDCNLKARFDSVFCSDACGVACLEEDLLRTFNYVSDVHPSLLRN